MDKTLNAMHLLAQDVAKFQLEATKAEDSVSASDPEIEAIKRSKADARTRLPSSTAKLQAVIQLFDGQIQEMARPQWMGCTAKAKLLHTAEFNTGTSAETQAAAAVTAVLTGERDHTVPAPTIDGWEAHLQQPR